MARIVPPKEGLAGPLEGVGPKLLKAAIGVVDSKGIIRIPIEGFFTLNPESYEENKQSNWVPQPINGQSDPIMQWSSGGARMISFDALVTRDVAQPPKKDLKSDLKNAALNAVGSIASNFFGVNVPPISDLLKGSSDTPELGISDYLNFYRSLLYPTYNKAGRLSSSPPLIVLFVGDSFTNSLNDYAEGQPITDKNHVWVITNLRIKITKQLLNLTPMEAVVSFQLVEYNIRSKGREVFYKDAKNSGISSDIGISLPSSVTSLV